MKHCLNRQAMFNLDGSLEQWHEWGVIGEEFILPHYKAYDMGFLGCPEGQQVMRASKALADSFAWTGKTDKDGEKIWEGSLLECYEFRRNETVTVVVEANEETALWQCKETVGSWMDWWYLHTIMQHHHPKVIGNTTENPEMMEIK